MEDNKIDNNNKKPFSEKNLVKVKNRALIKTKPFISDLGDNFLCVNVLLQITNHSTTTTNKHFSGHYGPNTVEIETERALFYFHKNSIIFIFQINMYNHILCIIAHDNISNILCFILLKNRNLLIRI